MTKMAEEGNPALEEVALTILRLISEAEFNVDGARRHRDLCLRSRHAFEVAARTVLRCRKKWAMLIEALSALESVSMESVDKAKEEFAAERKREAPPPVSPDCPPTQRVPLRGLSWRECHNFDPLDPCTNAACPLRGPCVAVQRSVPLIGACSELIGDCPQGPGYPEGPCKDCQHFKVCGALNQIGETEGGDGDVWQ